MNIRELSQHVEFEPNTYYAAFSAELESSAYPMWALLSHLSDTSTVELTRRILNSCQLALQDWLDAIDFSQPHMVNNFILFTLVYSLITYAVTLPSVNAHGQNCLVQHRVFLNVLHSLVVPSVAIRCFLSREQNSKHKKIKKHLNAHCFFSVDECLACTDYLKC